MISGKDVKEIEEKYKIKFSYDKSTGKYIACFTDCEEFKKYYKKRPPSQFLIIYKHKEIWYSYKPLKINYKSTSTGWGRPNQTGFGKIMIPNNLSDLTKYRLKEYLETGRLVNTKIGYKCMYLETKEDVFKYIDLCFKNLNNIQTLKNNELFNKCMEKYKENKKNINTIIKSNEELINKLHTIIQRNQQMKNDFED